MSQSRTEEEEAESVDPEEDAEPEYAGEGESGRLTGAVRRRHQGRAEEARRLKCRCLPGSSCWKKSLLVVGCDGGQIGVVLVQVEN